MHMEDVQCAAAYISSCDVVSPDSNRYFINHLSWVLLNEEGNQPPKHHTYNTKCFVYHIAIESTASNLEISNACPNFRKAKRGFRFIHTSPPAPLARTAGPHNRYATSLTAQAFDASKADLDSSSSSLLRSRLESRRSSHAVHAATYNLSETAARPSSPITRTVGLAHRVHGSSSLIGGNRRVASLPSIRSPTATRALQNLVPQAYPGDPRTSSPRGGSADRHARRTLSHHPRAGSPRVSIRGGGRLEGRSTVAARPGGMRQAGGDARREPGAGYGSLERRIGRDSTALRAVSARLDAAATAIDAVEIGVRSASDSLDSLLHLLESRPTAESRPVSGSTASERIDTVLGVRTSSPPRVSRDVPSSSPLFAASEMAEDSSGEFGAVESPVLSMELREEDSSEYRVPDPAHGLHTTAETAREGRETVRSRAVHSLLGQTGSFRPVSRPGSRNGISADSDESAVVFRPTVVRAEQADPMIVSALVGESEEDFRHTSFGGSTMNPSTPLPTPTSRRENRGEENSTSVWGHESDERDPLGHPTSTSSHEGGESASADIVYCARGGGIGQVPTTDTSSSLFLPQSEIILSQMTRSRSSQGLESGRVSPRGVEMDDSTAARVETGVANLPAGIERYNRRNSRVVETALPVLELEAAMDGIDAERGRLMLEIARLRGQQNESLVHLLRLQREQFIVRQRQVSTLADIVNSFGRTVEAAGALPHGEDSSLGRISGDVVSTLRRMLRLLSATIPAASSSTSSTTPDAVSASYLPQPAITAPDAFAPPLSSLPRVDREGLTRGHGPYAGGGRVALRPAGDLTQEVIDAALQALPRLAAAATAISGARRLQGFLAGEDGTLTGAASSRDTGRRCSAETIAALPDAPQSCEAAVGGCVICLSEENSVEQLLCHLPCDHVFHRVCVGKWLSVQASCPTCRRLVPDVGIGSRLASPEVA